MVEYLFIEYNFKLYKNTILHILNLVTFGKFAFLRDFKDEIRFPPF